MSKFKVRQRVRATRDVFGYPTAGKLGTVVAIASHGWDDIGVQFDEYTHGHDCSGVSLKSGSTGRLGHCVWCCDADLELVDNTCSRDWCEPGLGDGRTKACPLYDRTETFEDCGEYSEAHPEMRQLLIDYLRAEDASTKPAEVTK